jgi:hypothetical protein
MVKKATRWRSLFFCLQYFAMLGGLNGALAKVGWSIVRAYCME